MDDTSERTFRAVKPDVTVVVGDKEFQCHRAVLCLASDYFDAMLSNAMKENKESKIILLDKDPEEWKLFYTFINPSTSVGAKINEDNVLTLIPWFNLCLMESALEVCDRG